MGAPTPGGAAGDPRAMQAQPNPGPGVPQQLYLEEARARIEAAYRAEIGFVERLVWFWSNHFCISADKGPGRARACGRVRARGDPPTRFGRFADMLIAVETHPAMLRYLDNVRSIGPNSVVGRNRNTGLNENLAREILELHTLGVRTVYEQSDVTSFARVITGWSVVPFRQGAQRGGEFEFNPRLHEPGAQSVVRKTYPPGGMEQGLAVLNDLARHPATAKHIAQKLATHFVADAPPSALVDRLAKRFLGTQGNLKEVARVLVTSNEAWAAARADDSASWMDGLSQRLDIANQMSRRIASLVEPEAAIDTALGPLASSETRQAVTRAESRPQAWSLLLMSPEFQRR